MKVEQSPTNTPGVTRDSHDEANLTTHTSVRLGLAFGHFVYRFRWILLALWLVLLGVSAPFASRLPAILSGGGYSFSGSESVHVSNDLINKLRFPPSSITIVLQSATTSVSDPPYQQELQSILGKLRSFNNGSSIQTGGIGLTNPPAVPGQPPLSQSALFALYTSGNYKQIPTLAQGPTRIHPSSRNTTEHHHTAHQRI